MIHIYGLIDPRTHGICYVGQSIDYLQRFKQHLLDNNDTPKTRWLAELKAAGMTPHIVILDKATTKQEANYKENWWIVFARRQKWRSVNATHPGEWRADFGQLFSEQLRQEYSAFMVAIREQKPLVMITRSQFHVFLVLLKIIVAVTLGIVLGIGGWHLQYAARHDIMQSTWFGATLGLASFTMSYMAMSQKYRRAWFIYIYCAFYVLMGLWGYWS